MSDSNQKKIPDDELDLRSIGEKVYFVFTYPISLLLSNLLTALFFIAAAFILSVSLRSFIPKIYKSSFIIRPTDIKDKVYLKVLIDIPQLLKQKEYKALSKQLKLDISIVSEITAITLLPSVVKNSIDSLNCTEIVLEAKTPDNFILIQNGILNYLENNSYFLKIKNLQKKQTELGLQEINKDLAQLDSLKKLQLINYGKQSASNINVIPLNDLYNPTASYAMAITLNEKKLSLIAQLVFQDRFQLIKPCVIIKNHHWPPRILTLCCYLVPIFLLLCICFLFLKKLRSKKKHLL